MTQTATYPSAPSTPDPRAFFRDAFLACRRGTLALYDGVDDDAFRHQYHAMFSPVGWHLGHIAYTEALWVVHRVASNPLPFPELERTFAVDGLSKSERINIPGKDEVLDYAAAVRRQTDACLETLDLADADFLMRFVLQHESQHGETVTFLRFLGGMQEVGAIGSRTAPAAPAEKDEMIAVPSGTAEIGCDDAEALDNERPRHRVEVGDFRIGRYPVTQAAFRTFIEADGYRNRRWWSDEGWAWRVKFGCSCPRYWREGVDRHPVMGVSAYEAEAYCRFRGFRLPTETEWEKAALWNDAPNARRRFPWGDDTLSKLRANHDRVGGGTSPVGAHPAGQSALGADDMLGNVWEWTASTFAPYPGYRAFPYDGYSKIYFDGRHRVLRGGSWATRPWALRATLRNFYEPGTREILAGFRVAKDGLHD